MIYYDEALDRWRVGVDGSLNDLAFMDHNHDSRYLRSNADALPGSDNVHKLGSNTARFSEVNAVDFIGDLTGNADTATSMAALQTITFSGGVSGSYQTDGTGNKNVSLTVDAAGHSHTQHYTKTEADGRFLRRNADSTPDTDISYDLGDATHRWAQIFAQNFKGLADEAVSLQNARTISVSGDVAIDDGQSAPTFDGSGNITIPIKVLDNSHLHNSQYYAQSECNSLFMKLGAHNNPDANNTYDLGSDTYKWRDLYVVDVNADNLIADAIKVESSDDSDSVSMDYVGSTNTLSFRDSASANNTILDAYQFSGVAASASYADLAEKYTCAESFVYPGTIIKACETGEYDVEECGSELSKNVVGVASEAPAYLMNSEEEGIVVGRTGKVPVRIIGPIGKGQPIVSAGKGAARGIRRESELLYKIGVSFEENLQDEEKLVMCVI
jgi:hypothetical protein